VKKKIVLPALIVCMVAVAVATQRFDWPRARAQDSPVSLQATQSRSPFDTRFASPHPPGNANLPPQDLNSARALPSSNTSSITSKQPPPGVSPQALASPRLPGLQGNFPSGTGRYAYTMPPKALPPNTMTAEEIEETQQLQQLLQKIRSGTQADEGESDYRDELMRLLGKQLDRDLATREERLKEIEQRAAELRTQLEARRKNKEQMLEILMMLAENPSAGLGIPPQWMQALEGETNGAQSWPVQGPPDAYFLPDANPRDYRPAQTLETRPNPPMSPSAPVELRNEPAEVPKPSTAPTVIAPTFFDDTRENTPEN
jgi:hypothetical protein